jgi:P27 family predicted phage terminase small subunit
MKTAKPPNHLTADGKKLWQTIADDVELDQPALLILGTLCEQFDRMNQARLILKREGILVKDRFGQQKQHPACGIERDSAAAVMRAWRLLGFDQAPPDGR